MERWSERKTYTINLCLEFIGRRLASAQQIALSERRVSVKGGGEKGL